MMAAHGTCRRIASLVALLAVLSMLPGCGDDDSNLQLRSHGILIYRLLEGSSIESLDRAGVQEPLMGEFEVGPPSGLTAPNTFFNFTIRSVHLRSSSFKVQGTAGSMTGETFALTILADATVVINGQPIELMGAQHLDFNTFRPEFPPIFRGLPLVGGGYNLVIFAVPEA